MIGSHVLINFLLCRALYCTVLVTAPVHLVGVVVVYVLSEIILLYSRVVALITLVESLSCVCSYVPREMRTMISPVMAVGTGEPLHLLVVLVYTPDVSAQVETLCEALLTDMTLVFLLCVRVPDSLLPACVLREFLLCREQFVAYGAVELGTWRLHISIYT